MELSLNDYAYSLLNIVNPKLMDDQEVDIRQLKNWIIDTRLVFIKNTLNKNRSIDSSITQTIPANNFDIEFVTSNNGQAIYRTTIKIPKLVQLNHGVAIVRVGPKSINEPSFKLYLDINEVAFSGNGRFNKHLPIAYVDGEYMYFKTTNPIFAVLYANNISITGVFADPRTLSGLSTENGEAIYSDRYTPFPMNRDMKTYIEKEILSTHFPITQSSLSDDINDGVDNSIEKAIASRQQKRK